MRHFNFVQQDSVGVLTFFTGQGLQSVRTDHVNFKKIRDGLKDNVDDQVLLDLLNPVSTKETKAAPEPRKVSDVRLGKVEFVNGQLLYNGEVVECQGLVDRVKLLQEQELPFDGMYKFISRLFNNVSSRTRKELLDFIDRNGLTIDSEGYFIAYKAVRNDYMDKYSGTIDNTPGRVIEMDRSKVDDDFTVGCSKGLHAGALTYVYEYGGGADRIVVVKIDPADVVSVPSDCNYRKLRTCRYEVLCDYNGELDKVCYDSVDDMYDYDDHDDEDDDDFDWESVLYDNYEEEEEEDEEDDYFDDGDVTSEPSVSSASPVVRYGTKPNGAKYHNRRDNRGRFC